MNCEYFSHLCNFLGGLSLLKIPITELSFPLQIQQRRVSCGDVWKTNESWNNHTAWWNGQSDTNRLNEWKWWHTDTHLAVQNQRAGRQTPENRWSPTLRVTGMFVCYWRQQHEEWMCKMNDNQEYQAWNQRDSDSEKQECRHGARKSQVLLSRQIREKPDWKAIKTLLKTPPGIISIVDDKQEDQAWSHRVWFPSLEDSDKAHQRKEKVNGHIKTLFQTAPGINV